MQRKAENRAVAVAGRGHWSLENVEEQRQEIQYNSCSCIFSELAGGGQGGEISSQWQGKYVVVVFSFIERERGRGKDVGYKGLKGVTD